jgi:hypothetical protein
MMVKNNFIINQQNKHLSLTLTHWTQKRPRHMTLEIQVLAWDWHKNVSVLNLLMGTQPSPC